jgi:hypothetical protein
MLDVDDTVREVHGHAKQGAAFGYTRQRGLNVQLATISTPLAAPVIARARLRSGNTASAKGAGRMLAQAITTARAAGVTGRILARADSAYYGWAFVGTAIGKKAWFSVTARMTKTVTAAITSIPADAWTPIKYPQAIWEPGEQPGDGHWVSDAEVAEIRCVAFTGRRKAEHVACRLVVRRVKRLQPRAGDGNEQGELFATYRHHAFITNSSLGLVEADERHRDHAIVEQAIRELKEGPAGAPSVREVRSERSLGRMCGDRVQHRPRHRRRRADAHRPLDLRPPPRRNQRRDDRRNEPVWTIEVRTPEP